MRGVLLFLLLTLDWQDLSVLSRALVSLCLFISPFLGMGARLLWMKFQQEYEGMFRGF